MELEDALTLLARLHTVESGEEGFSVLCWPVIPPTVRSCEVRDAWKAVREHLQLQTDPWRVGPDGLP